MLTASYLLKPKQNPSVKITIWNYNFNDAETDKSCKCGVYWTNKGLELLVTEFQLMVLAENGFKRLYYDWTWSIIVHRVRSAGQTRIYVSYDTSDESVNNTSAALGGFKKLVWSDISPDKFLRMIFNLAALLTPICSTQTMHVHDYLYLCCVEMCGFMHNVWMTVCVCGSVCGQQGWVAVVRCSWTESTKHMTSPECVCVCVCFRAHSTCAKLFSACF